MQMQASQLAGVKQQLGPAVFAAQRLGQRGNLLHGPTLGRAPELRP